MIALIDQRGFPSLDQSVKALWAPIILEPISGSYERLVAGVAVVNASGFHVELANSLHRLECLFGEDASAAVMAVRIAGESLRRDLSQRSVDAIQRPESAVSGIYVGECREAEGTSLQHIATSWMAVLSSLYEAVPIGEELDEDRLAVDAKKATAPRDRLPFLVCDYVRQHRENYTRYFSQDLQEGGERRRRGGSHHVVIDFAGPRLVANFGTLQAGALTKSVHLIKRRLWDLKVERDKDRSPVLVRQHEMILQRPSSDDPQVTVQQQSNISEALEALEAQADQEELRLLALESVTAIGQRILSYELAA